MRSLVGSVDGRVVDGGPARLAFSKVEASAALGVSVDFFEQHVMPELRIVRRGRGRLIPLAELERWLSENASMVLAS